MPMPTKTTEQSTNNRYSRYGVVTDMFRRQFMEQSRTEAHPHGDSNRLKTPSPTIRALMTVLEKVPECESCTELAPVLDVTSEDQLYKGEYSLTTEGFKFWNTKERTAGEAPGRKLQYQLFREQVH